MIFLGIDIGAITAKAVLLAGGNEIRNILATHVTAAGYNREETALSLQAEIFRKTGIDREQVGAVGATGYGRKAVTFADHSVTEITCHGRGALFLNPETDFVIDIGGQDAKGIRINSAGKVIDFVMNDKCAAGTGRFLEVMAHAMEVDLDQFDRLSASAVTPASITSICTVFAESEVVSHLAGGVSREAIIAGIHISIAERVATMLASTMPASIDQGSRITMTGGVSKNGGVVRALEDTLEASIFVPELGQVAGALGAALIAEEKAGK